MCRRGAMLALAVAFAALSCASAGNWDEDLAISSLWSGGVINNPGFLTVTGTYSGTKNTLSLILQKPLATNIQCSYEGETANYCSQPPHELQRFSLDYGGSTPKFFPDSTFKLKYKSGSTTLYLLKTASNTLKFSATKATLWTINKYGRVRSEDGYCWQVYCSDYAACDANPSKVPLRQKILLKACSEYAAPEKTEQFNMVTTYNPTPFRGVIMSMDATNPTPMCLLAKDQIVPRPGVAKRVYQLQEAPRWVPCDFSGSNASQIVVAEGSVDAGLSTWSSGFFKLRFPEPNLCITTYCPVCEDGIGRIGLIMTVSDCAKKEIDGFFNEFLWNSRAQLQSNVQPSGGLNAALPVCLSRTGPNTAINLNDKYEVTGGDCSFRRMNNRWNFIFV